VFNTRDLDALEVNPQRQSQNGNNDVSNHESFADLCFSAVICGSFLRLVQ
jgi:hypothetical protein